MTSLVSDYIFSPVLRQARRLSSIATDLDVDKTEAEALDGSCSSQRDAVSETAPTPEDGPVAPSLDAHVTLSTTAPIGHSGPLPIESPVPETRSPELLAPPPTHEVNISDTETDTEMMEESAATRRTLRSEPLPEDDGMGPFRQKIIAIHRRDIPPPEKARLMHALFYNGYAKSHLAKGSAAHLRPNSPSTANLDDQGLLPGALETLRIWQNSLVSSFSSEKLEVTARDIRRTFAPLRADETEDDGIPLGCEHYRRNVKLQCSTCYQWYTCRFCHDAVEDHALIRKETKYMLCMLCGCPQKATDVCAYCGESAARYYCAVCKLWNDDPDKSVYHCNDCGICRVGRGVGKDFFHCKKCNACIAIGNKNDHRCIEGVTDCDCPICGEYMFTSPKSVVLLKCGHSIHYNCYDEHMKSSYKCPICNRSVVNMETQFRNLDLTIMMQPMPPEFQDTRAKILCNDCHAKSSVKYHWVGLKCANCNSYNTTQLGISGGPSETRRGSQERVAGGQDTHLANQSGTGERTLAIDIPRSRRPADQRPGTSMGGDSRGFSPLVVPDRLARSASPVPVLAFADLPLQETDISDEEDMMDFWGRDGPRSATSAEVVEYEDDEGSDADSDDDSDDCEEDMEDEDDDDDEEDEIALFGHR